MEKTSRNIEEITDGEKKLHLSTKNFTVMSVIHPI